MEKTYRQSPLNFKGKRRDYVLQIISRLYEIPRTGWVDRKVNSPETVGEHTAELIDLANHFYPFTPGLNRMLKIHDWPESAKGLGDIRTDHFCPTDHRWTKAEKYEAEFTAMRQICANLGLAGKNILNLWLEFEEGKTERADLARQLDKFQAIKKALYYQKKGEPVKAQEFWEVDGAKIKNPELIKVLEKHGLIFK